MYLAAGPVYRECHVDTPARLNAGTRQLDFWPPTGGGAPPAPRCFSARVEFVVDAAGRVEDGTVRIVRSDDAGLADALVRSVPGWRYRPAEFEGAPVRQIVMEQAAIAVTVSRVPAGQVPGGPGSGPPPGCRP